MFAVFLICPCSPFSFPSHRLPLPRYHRIDLPLLASTNSPGHRIAIPEHPPNSRSNVTHPAGVPLLTRNLHPSQYPAPFASAKALHSSSGALDSLLMAGFEDKMCSACRRGWPPLNLFECRGKILQSQTVRIPVRVCGPKVTRYCGVSW